MRKINLLLPLVFTLNIFIVFAHRDRMEQPISYQFILQNHDTIRLDHFNDSLLKAYNDDIVHGKLILKSAELLFETGETIFIKNAGKNWSEMKISDGKKEVNIPQASLIKIPEIHFASIALLWNGDDKKAFNASYFYIQFEIGTDRPFDKLSTMQLIISNMKFKQGIIWRQTSENARQRSIFK